MGQFFDEKNKKYQKASSERQLMGLGRALGNQGMLSYIGAMPIQRTKWQYHASNDSWYQIDGAQRGTHIVPRWGLRDGMVFDDVTGERLPPIRRFVVAAGSGYNEGRALADEAGRGVERTGTDYVTDIQTEEQLQQYPRYEEGQRTLQEQGGIFAPGVDATASMVKAPEVFVPFVETGNRDGRRGPLTSEVVRDIFTRQDEIQDEGDRIVMGIYTGGEGQYHMGQRYGVRPGLVGTHYQLTRRQQFAEPPLHEMTRDHSRGVAFTTENTRVLTFEKRADVTEEMDDPSTDDEAYDGFL